MTDHAELIERLRNLAKAYAGSALTAPLLSEQRGFMSRSNLMTDTSDALSALVAERDAQAAEIAKLREALTTIGHSLVCAPTDYAEHNAQAIFEAGEIARAALAQGGEKP